MIRVRQGLPAEAVNQAAQHVLFVEGHEDGIDVACLRAILAPPVEVKPLGPAFDVKSVARALYAHHPTYYFVIDRDHAEENEVEHSWANFPDPQTANLLIWRRKELESYFIDPTFFVTSSHIKPTVTLEAIQNFVVQEARKTLLREAANATLISIREDLKRKSVKTFDENFKSPAQAKSALVARLQSSDILQRSQLAVDSGNLEAKFDTSLAVLTGGASRLEWGKGAWLTRMSAKIMLNKLVTKFCRVQDTGGQFVQGRDALMKVVRDLLRANSLPDDFLTLRKLIQERITHP